MSLYLWTFLFFLISNFCFGVIKAEKKYGVLVARTSLHEEEFCIIYFSEFGDLPSDRSSSQFRVLRNERAEDFCRDVSTSLKNNAVVTNYRNCSLTDQVQNMKNQGAGAALFISHDDMTNIDVNSSVAKDINITVAFLPPYLSSNSVALQDNSEVMMFSPKSSSIDLSLILIWLMAVFSVFVGSYWSGLVRYELYCSEVNPTNAVEEDSPGKEKSGFAEPSSLNVTPLLILIFVLFMGVTLLLLYFFYSYLVYILIALFVVASIVSLFNCFEPLVRRIPIGTSRLPEYKCCSVECSFEIRKIFLFIFSLILPITWVILRKASFSWILQDILGVVFCINMLKSVRLPNLKICTILFVLLFLYDIFFVFATPLLTPKGDSIMVQVATGGNSNEQLPMVLRVPHFGSKAISVCYQQYSLLGFGDVLVPGLLISFCHGMDLLLQKKKLYLIISTAGYGIGLVVTYGSLYLMNTPQPALLYLVPLTLLPIIFVSLCQKEFKILWNGRKSVLETPLPNDADVTRDQPQPISNVLSSSKEAISNQESQTSDSNENQSSSETRK